MKCQTTHENLVDVLLNVANPDKITDNTTALMSFYSVTPVVHLLEQSEVALPFSALMEVRAYTVYLITIGLVSWREVGKLGGTSKVLVNSLSLEDLRPPREVCEAHLHPSYKPCVTGAIPSQTYGDV